MFCQTSPPWPSWLALQDMTHSFTELDKAVVHVIRLVSFLWLWFSVSALWWRRIRGLWKLPDGVNWLRGKLGLSKSLIQFSVDGWSCVPSWLFKVKSLSLVQLLATPWTVAYQPPLSMGLSKQEYWSELPFPSPGDLPNPGIKPGSPALQTDALPFEPLHLLFTWGQTMLKVMKTMVTSFKTSHTSTAPLSAPSPVAGHHQCLCWRLPDTHRQVWVSLVWHLKQNHNSPAKIKCSKLTQWTKEIKNYIYQLRPKLSKAQTGKQN